MNVNGENIFNKAGKYLEKAAIAQQTSSSKKNKLLSIIVIHTQLTLFLSIEASKRQIISKDSNLWEWRISRATKNLLTGLQKYTSQKKNYSTNEW